MTVRSMRVEFFFFCGGENIIFVGNLVFTIHMCQGLNSHCFPMVGMVINLQDRLSHHPRYGDPELQRPALNGTVFFAGTETARRHGGAVVENGPHLGAF